ncbi:MAG TPA: membrane protein insertase YidC [Candidatus Eisenbacteria bacterium]|nr:membrane protein insertase YidC [Candidatus Eisenbacteria bacterium]
MDRRTIVLVALCLVLFLGYPFILRFFGLGQYLGPPPRQSTDTTLVAVPDTTPAPSAAPAAAPAISPADTATARSEQVVTVENDLYRAWFSTRGARLLGVELKRYATAGAAAESRHRRLKEGEVLPDEDRVQLRGEPALRLETGAAGRGPEITYQVSESLDAAGQIRVLTFTGRDPSGAEIRQTYRLEPNTYAIGLEVAMRGSNLTEYRLTARSWPLAHEHNQAEEERSLRATSQVGSNLHREGTGGLRKGPKSFEGNASWAAVQTRYFGGVVAITRGTARGTTAGLESRNLTAEERARLGPQAKPVQELVTNTLIVSVPGESDSPDRFLVYFGPNEYFPLGKLGHGLENLVDLGWSWIRPFSKLLLQMLLWLYGVIHNYGLAIIVLATLVRVLLHPLSMMSMKSMREMQKVQPEVERIRQKYKNDAQAMNAAMMALYKEHKINPAGGCLPMLVQMPLFIALYSVLFNAIELRQAPFVAWVDDLSAPDSLFPLGIPYVESFRVLPILMMLSGLLQQKLTPTDPRQAASMYFMNVLMLVFFYHLPSGLVLYWTVMNLLTALQQWLALREDGGHKAEAAVSPVAARGGSK